MAVADDKDTCEKERNKSEGRKASKDSGKMLDFFPPILLTWVLNSCVCLFACLI